MGEEGDGQRYALSRDYDARARVVIPGGHHSSGRALVDLDRSPSYFEGAKGCHIWDVDGNEYIDFVLAYGAILLGYAHEEVDDAVLTQARRGNLVSLNHPIHVRFVEALVARFPAADQALFFKSGSEATTAALRIARRATGRRTVARAGYHGWHDWCFPEEACVPGGLAEQVREFDAQDVTSLATLLDEHGSDVAAVIVAPEMLRPLSAAPLRAIAELARAYGAVFVLDEVKTAFRMRSGSIQEHFGVRPDLTTVSKALGNGWPVAAVLGRRDVMRGADGAPLSATYHGETTAMAAALEVMRLLDRDRVADHVWRLGERLIDGLGASLRAYGVPGEAYGEPLPPMPFLRFNSGCPALDEAIRATFFTEVLARGVLLHPRHLWFLSAAHTDADIDRTLEICDAALAIAAARHG